MNIRTGTQQNEMKKLENSLFSSLYSPVEFGKDEARDEVYNTSAFFFTDKSANSVLPAYEDDVDMGGESNELEASNLSKPPVWIDDEEEETSVNIAKVNRLRKLRKEEDESHGVAVATCYGDPQDAEDILKTNQNLVLKRSAKLLPGLLEYSKLGDANREDPRNAPVNSVHFHKNAQLLLVGGLDRILRFFQVDGKTNEKIQSIFLEDCPIRKAAFLPDGSQAIISGRRKFAYNFDLVKAQVDRIGPLSGRDEKSLESFEVSPDSKTIAFLGNEGHILLVSSKTKELVGTLKMNGTVRSVAFTKDGQQLLSSGGDGKIYHWDLRTRSCFHIGAYEGCLNGTSLCASGNLFAAGSDSGIVNIYNRDEFLGGKKKPLKTVENLTTERRSDIGDQSSHPSITVFSNWPPPNQALHYPSCMDFSPNGGFMALGNAAGKVLLYKLHHYHHA